MYELAALTSQSEKGVDVDWFLSITPDVATAATPSASPRPRPYPWAPDKAPSSRVSSWATTQSRARPDTSARGAA